MTTCKRLVLVALTVCVACAWGQSNRREPHLGYLYPAGGRQGAVVEITAGGQFLGNVTDVYVSGEGVRASVVRYVGRFNLMGDQVEELRRRVEVLWKQRRAELIGEPVPLPEGAATDNVGAGMMRMVRLPDHPLIANLEDKSVRELAYIRYEFENYGKRQPNAQIEETVLIEIVVDPDAAPGDRELRLGTREGLTNPMRFQVGTLPEVCETELNNPVTSDPLPKEPAIDLPVLLNGQILPGDIDRFCFGARRGQRLVIEAQARRLVPYLADAVPGWFQATLALYDAGGKEVAFVDDYEFSPDPVFFYEVPETGEYELEVRDAIYRGREDFIYRISVSEGPFVTEMFPLGGRESAKTVASVAGWNLPEQQLPLDTGLGGGRIRHALLRQENQVSNEVPYAVDTLPESTEAEPNNTVQDAQRVDLPKIVNGRVGQPGDVDVFWFEGRAGDEIVAEVLGRRLHSPLDSLVRLTDESGDVLAFNDDSMLKDGYLHTGPGTLTHHADSYLSAELPEDGVYCVHLSDSQNHGGQAYGYRLRISPPLPDFALRVTPSSVTVDAGRAALLNVHALRQDGFEGEIEFALKDAPRGFVLNGARIHAGRDSARMTLSGPPEPLDEPVVLRIEGRALIGGQTVTRTAVPSEDMMQAFLYRHLTPSQELMAAVRGPRHDGRPIKLAGGGPVRIPVGGTVEVRFRTPDYPELPGIQLEIDDPPEGMALHGVEVESGGVTFRLSVDDEATQAGFSDNLIVEVFLERTRQTEGGTTKTERFSVGILPAIPFEIVGQ